MFSQHVLLLIVAVSVIGAPIAAAGQEEPNCFCLRHKASGSIAHFGCKSVTVRNRFTPETQCLNAKLTAKTTIEDRDAFEVVADGKDGCHPCIPELPLPPQKRLDHPRGNEEGQNQ